MAQGALRGAPARASRIAWTSAIVLGTLALFVPSALAVHSIGLFEVDGNASEQSPVGEDWEIMFPVMGPTNSTAQVFVQDVGEILTVIGGSGGSFFAGGSSKDDINSTSWLWNGPGPQDKGNISDAYAAVYEANGNQYVFFGMDRFDNNGDVAVSFWFFQDDIAPIIDGDGDYVFSAGHTTGDILIQTAYTNGGVIGTISVYRWNDADAAAPTGPLDLIATGLDCTNPALPAGHIACGRVNAGLEPSPWPFESKPNNNAPSDTFQPRGFLEIGLNLTQALGGADQCLGTFIAETRSSQTIDSTLKDFALGSFNTCQPEAIVDLSKVAANTPVGYGDDVVFDIEVSNLGPDEANFVTLVDNLTEISGNWTVSGADAGDCSIDESGTPDVLTCDFGTMLFPSSKTITLTGGTGGDPADCGAVPNSADLTWDSGTATDSDTVTVQCGNIIVDKDCDPSSDTTTSFDFDPNWASDLDVLCGGSEDSGPLAPGSYDVSENALAGWTLDDVTCESTLAHVEDESSLDLQPDETITCTFTNEQLAKITACKDTDPAESLQSFEIVSDFNGTFNLADGECNTSGWLDADDGPFGANETVPAGWELDAADCDNGDTADLITLSPGDDVTCTFENQQLAKITACKDTEPDGATDLFEFDSDFNGTFSLADGECNVSPWLDSDDGPFAVGETPPAGWTVDSVECTDGVDDTIDNGSIALGPGDEVTCTFTNIGTGDLHGSKFHDKDADGIWSPGLGEEGLAGWVIFLDLNGNGTLDVDEPWTTTGTDGSYNFTGLAADTYLVCEQQQAGWAQTAPASGCYEVELNGGDDVQDLDFGNVNEREGTIGFWRNWDRHNTYTEAEIDGWLGDIDDESQWFMPDLFGSPDADYSNTTDGLVALINDSTKYCSKKFDSLHCAKAKFSAQCIVTYLDEASGRKFGSTVYDLSGFGAAASYLGLGTTATLDQIQSAIEGKYGTNPTRAEYLRMMSVCDYINNLGL